MEYSLDYKTQNNYELIIIGSGCSGLTSGIYAGRYKLKTLIIGSSFGGVILEAHNIENYPGFTSITGIELMKKFKKSVDLLNIPILQKEVISIKKQKNKFCIQTRDNNLFYSTTIIICCGTKRRKLSIEGEEKFKGKGVSYCTTCDAPVFAERIVAVIGGSNSACQSAILLSKYASKVYIIYRQNKLRAEPINIENVIKNKKIKIIYNTNIVKLNGKNYLESIELDNIYKESKILNIDGIFVEIGAEPSVYFAEDLNLELSKNKEIIVDKFCNTNIKGVYAAGDITDTPFRQLITACGQGAIAALSAYKYILKKKKQKLKK